MPELALPDPPNWCAECSEPLPDDDGIITLLGMAEVNTVCSIQCAQDVLQRWQEHIDESGGSGCIGC